MRQLALFLISATLFHFPYGKSAGFSYLLLHPVCRATVSGLKYVKKTQLPKESSWKWEGRLKSLFRYGTVDILPYHTQTRWGSTIRNLNA